MFRRSVQIDPREDLKTMLETRASPGVSWGIRIVILSTVFSVFLTLVWLANTIRCRPAV